MWGEFVRAFNLRGPRKAAYLKELPQKLRQTLIKEEEAAAKNGGTRFDENLRAVQTILSLPSRQQAIVRRFAGGVIARRNHGGAPGSRTPTIGRRDEVLLSPLCTPQRATVCS